MHSIRTKLAILVSVAVIAAVLPVSLISAWTGASQQFAAKRDELQGIAAAIATTVAHPMAQGDRDGIARTLSAVGRIPGVTFARVTDAGGRVVHQFGTGVVVARTHGPVEASPSIGPLTTHYLSTYPVVAPIVSGGLPIGQLALISDLSALRSAAFDRFRTALSVGIMAMTMAILLSWRLHRSIADPVRNLMTAMQDVAKSKAFGRRVARTSNDEVGKLVDAFNGMLEEVGQRDDALARHRAHLESEVDLRTADLARAKHVAEAASAAKSEFLATMSHEIRTPMGGLLTVAELMATADLPPRLQRYADVMLNSGHTLLAIINDILDFSKIEAGKLELEAVPVRLRVVVDDVLELFNDRAHAKGIDLTAYIAADVPTVIAADAVRLSQVLSNLINNALKFTTSGSVHVVVAMADGGGVSIEVQDTGIGIPADKLATIFEAFSQADQSTTRQFGGTGIGLTICRRIVAAMGGEISVRSTLGRGSVFAVTAPLVVLEPATQPSMIAGDAGARTVVIALGETASADCLQRYVEARGLVVMRVAGDDPDMVSNAGAVRAVFAAPDRLNALRQRYLSGTKAPIAVSLSRFGDISGADRDRAADLQVRLPLSCDEISRCLDAVVAGSAVMATAQPLARTAAPLPLAHAGRRVLAADDNAVNREVLTEALGRLGVSVVCVENGEAAVAKARTEVFDMILMDCSMPVMDGYAATHAIRQWERAHAKPPIPIVALTAYVVGQRAEAWRTAGMTGYLAKPYTLATLRGALDAALKDCGPAASAAIEDRSTRAPVIAGNPVGKLIDSDVLASIRDMEQPGDDLVARVLKLYAVHAPKTLTALEAVGETDGLVIADAAHALRSLSRNVGAVQVSDLCEQLEDAARAGDLSNVGAIVQSIRRSLIATLSALATMEISPSTSAVVCGVACAEASAFRSAAVA